MYDTRAKLHDCWSFANGTRATFGGIGSCAAYEGDAIAFSSVESAGIDFTGELVAAARKAGIAPGLYFSHIDWFDPNMRIDQWNPVGTKQCVGKPCDVSKYSNVTDPMGWERFVLRHRAQVLEVLTKYGELLELSFDMNFPSSFDDEMRETIRLARVLAPNTLFRGRGMGGAKGTCDEATSACPMGDYETPEETFPSSPLPGQWQVIYHGSAFMSYDPVAAHYVNGSFIVWHLVDIVAKGGLMQIGYGPDADGRFHPKALEALGYAGRWLATNGEAIYATRPLPQRWNDTASGMVRYTRAKVGTTIYATVLQGFGSPQLAQPSQLPLACVNLAPDALVTILGFVDEASRAPIPLRWNASSHRRSHVVIALPLPADLRKHEAILEPGFVVKMQRATPVAC